MAFTADDLETVECAIKEISAGKRQVSLTLSDRMVRYSDPQLPDLIKLRDQIRAEVDAADTTGPRPRIFRTRFSKGL